MSLGWDELMSITDPSLWPRSLAEEIAPLERIERQSPPRGNFVRLFGPENLLLHQARSPMVT
jgi:hypothetical protein